jgi:hypothetical protein
MTATSVVVGPFPGGTPGMPSFAGQSGTTNEGEHVVAIASELPRPHPKGSKEDRELAQVMRFSDDFEMGTGEKLFSRVERGGGPTDFPDFVFHESSATEAPRELECTQLIVSERLGPSATFQAYRQAVLGTNRDRFRHLRGLVVLVDFDDFVGFHHDPEARSIPRKAFLAALSRLEPPPPEPPEPPMVLDTSRILQFAPGARVWTELLGPSYDSRSFGGQALRSA